MLLSLVLLACANKPIDTEVPDVSLDARTGTMVPEVAKAERVRPAVRMPEGEPIVRECYSGSGKKKGRASMGPTGGGAGSSGYGSGGTSAASPPSGVSAGKSSSARLLGISSFAEEALRLA